jgi:hypothetical protein
MKNYKILKLKSGEDLIGDIRVGRDGNIKIHRPMIFKSMVQPDLFGGMKEIVMLKNWLMLSDDNVAVIAKESDNTIINASKDVTALYEVEKMKEDKIPLPKAKAKKPTKPKTNAPNIDENPFDFLERQIEEMIKKAEEADMIGEKESDLKDVAKPQKGDKMVYMNMIFSPEVIIQMLKTGILDRKEFGEIINEITNENGEGMNPQKYTGNKKDKKNLGNDWTDWQSDPSSEDYK